MLCCGKATPRGHSRCMPVAICAEWLRKCAVSRIAGQLWCDRNAAGCWRRTRGSDAHRNCDMRRTARGIIRTQRAAQHAQSQPCCCPINTHARAKSPGAIAELRHLPCAACDRCGLRHAFRSGQPVRLLQQADGIVAAMDAARGGQSLVDVIGDAWQDMTDGAQKNGGRSNCCDHRDRPSRAAYLVARRAYLLRIDICGLSLPSLPGCTVKKYSGFHHAPAAHQVQPSHTSLFFSI